MKHELAMRLFSRRPLTAAVAERQISALSCFDRGLLRPDKCSQFEPIRTPFDPSDINGPVHWLSRPSGTFMYRKGQPTSSTGVIWNLSHPELWDTDDSGKKVRIKPASSERVFLNYWTADFDGRWTGKVGVEKLVSFASEMFQVSGADFGFLTSLEDLNAKNYLVVQKGQGRSMSYEGLDPSRGVPGLYWVNLFSDAYARWLGVRAVPADIGVIKGLPENGVLLQFGSDPSECQSQETIKRQQQLIQRLGERRFFDIRRPERDLEGLDWTQRLAVQ